MATRTEARAQLLTTSISSDDSKPPCVVHSMIRGSLGFGLVSVAAFSVWALGVQSYFGEIGMYAACAFVFVALSGLLLRPLMRGSESLLSFYAVFIPAFLSYAMVWCIAWFLLRFGAGEWLGSLLGTAAFAGVVSWRFHNARGLIQRSLVVFGLHSAGYFLGGQLMHWLLGHSGAALLNGLSKSGIAVVAKLAWGLVYGLGFGAGIGYAFHTAQQIKTSPNAGGT